MKTVVGLFGNQKDAGRAVEMLTEKDLEEDLKVIRRGTTGSFQQVSPEPSASSRKGTESDEAGFLSRISSIVKIPFMQRFASHPIESAGIGDLTHYLIDRGLRDEEAGFLQGNIERGGTLLVLEVGEQDVPLVKNILNEAQVIVR